MRFKKILAVMMTVIVAFVFSAPCYAYSKNPGSEISPLYTLAINPTAQLTISGSSATCESYVVGFSSKVTNITVVQTLQKHWAFGIYSDVPGASWSKSVDDSSISIYKTITGLESGTYRLQAVFTLTAKDGTTETITVYSR